MQPMLGQSEPGGKYDGSKLTAEKQFLFLIGLITENMESVKLVAIFVTKW